MSTHPTHPTTPPPTEGDTTMIDLLPDVAPRTRIALLRERWDEGLIDKYEFYGQTMRHRPSTIAEVTGIPRAVIDDRRRYLRILATTTPKEQ